MQRCWKWGCLYQPMSFDPLGFFCCCCFGRCWYILPTSVVPTIYPLLELSTRQLSFPPFHHFPLHLLYPRQSLITLLPCLNNEDSWRELFAGEDDGAAWQWGRFYFLHLFPSLSFFSIRCSNPGGFSVLEKNGDLKLSRVLSSSQPQKCEPKWVCTLDLKALRTPVSVNEISIKREACIRTTVTLLSLRQAELNPSLVF